MTCCRIFDLCELIYDTRRVGSGPEELYGFIPASSSASISLSAGERQSSVAD